MLVAKRLLFYASAAVLLLSGFFIRNPALSLIVLVILLVLTGRATRWRLILLLTVFLYCVYRNMVIYDNFDSFIVLTITIPVIFKTMLGGLK